MHTFVVVNRLGSNGSILSSGKHAPPPPPSRPPLNTGTPRQSTPDSTSDNYGNGYAHDNNNYSNQRQQSSRKHINAGATAGDHVSNAHGQDTRGRTNGTSQRYGRQHTESRTDLSSDRVFDSYSDYVEGSEETYDSDRRAVGNRSGGQDALTHEIDQRPNVRGSLSDAASAPRASRNDKMMGAGVGMNTRTGRGRNATDYYAANGNASQSRRVGDMDRQRGGREEIGESVHDNENGLEEEVSENADFFASLREADGAGSLRKENAGGGRGGKGGLRKHGTRRPDWNSDTAGASSLGEAHTEHVTDNSPAAIQVQYAVFVACVFCSRWIHCT